MVIINVAQKEGVSRAWPWMVASEPFGSKPRTTVGQLWNIGLWLCECGQRRAGKFKNKGPSHYSSSCIDSAKVWGRHHLSGHVTPLMAQSHRSSR